MGGCLSNQEPGIVDVTKVLVERVFAYFGTPLQILTDQGSNFQSELFVELLKRLKVDQVRTSPYKPSTNGLIEIPQDAEFHSWQVGEPITARLGRVDPVCAGRISCHGARGDKLLPKLFDAGSREPLAY